MVIYAEQGIPDKEWKRIIIKFSKDLFKRETPLSRR
jgi:hypothetical protein